MVTFPVLVAVGQRVARETVCSQVGGARAVFNRELKLLQSQRPTRVDAGEVGALHQVGQWLVVSDETKPVTHQLVPEMLHSPDSSAHLALVGGVLPLGLGVAARGVADRVLSIFELLAENCPTSIHRPVCEQNPWPVTLVGAQHRCCSDHGLDLVEGRLLRRSPVQCGAAASEDAEGSGDAGEVLAQKLPIEDGEAEKTLHALLISLAVLHRRGHVEDGCSVGAERADALITHEVAQRLHLSVADVELVRRPREAVEDGAVQNREDVVNVGGDVRAPGVLGVVRDAVGDERVVHIELAHALEDRVDHALEERRRVLHAKGHPVPNILLAARSPERGEVLVALVHENLPEAVREVAGGEDVLTARGGVLQNGLYAGGGVLVQRGAAVDGATVKAHPILLAHASGSVLLPRDRQVGAVLGGDWGF